jgi:hypothetical protein
MNILYLILGLECIHYLITLLYYHFYTQNKNITVNEHEKIEKITNNINSINEKNVNIIYEEIKEHYKDNKLTMKNSLFLFPNFLIEKIFMTIYFNSTLRYYSNHGFNIKYTHNGIYLIKHTNDNLILINSGIGGFINNCSELVSKIDNHASIIITVYRCGLFNFYWKRSAMNDYCDEIINLIKDYKKIEMASHSLGCYVAENILKKNDKQNLNLNFTKEILFEPACAPSAGLVFANSLALSTYNFINLLNRFSDDRLFNIYFALKFKSLEMVSIINSLENIDGIRFESRKSIKTFVVVGINDPLANISRHPFKHEIDTIFDDCHIIWHDHYHGNFYRHQDMVYKMLKLDNIVHDENYDYNCDE